MIFILTLATLLFIINYYAFILNWTMYIHIPTNTIRFNNVLKIYFKPTNA